MSEQANVDSTPESQMAYYSEHALPTALIDLRNKHGYVSEVIKYCEAAYLTNDKKEIEAQTKEYMADALGAVVKDIELITSNLTSFLDLQIDAIDSLTPQLDLVKNRIALVKAQHAQNRLQRARKTVTGQVLEEKKEALEEDQKSLNSRKLPEYTRVPLQDRLKMLDGVGHCLNKS
ncbi:hypothetical protein TrVE_jg2015 [Triparma verrucosa]|uniref:Uncharacterized protein n=2 Tax=Triparma TaxID=722752 RepID=A0A9W7BVG0_9STRA|nr:hypothetical protein TrST_g3270 [Triparma strigata]GMI01068.1 hypothetical protein TrVE_jg2015 [Triparma verrucosa]